MKKFIIGFVILLCTVVIFASCSNNIKPDNTNESETNISEVDPQPVVAELISTGDVISSEDEAIGGSSNDCIHASAYNDSFHSFSYDFAKYVTTEKFAEWIALPYESTEECKYFGQNIYEFIKYFDISKEVFTEIYYSTDTYYSFDYNIDILYGGNEDEIYKYYENGGNYKEQKKRSLEQSIKIYFSYYIDRTQYDEWKESNDYDSVISWSIPEIIYEFDIPQSVFEEIVNNNANPPEELLPEAMYDSSVIVIQDEEEIEETEIIYYDYEKIYENREEIQALIDNDTPSYIIDEMIHG